MQKLDIREVLERVRSGEYSPSDELLAKYWIHQVNQDTEVELSDREWLEVKGLIWDRLSVEVSDKEPAGTAMVRRLWLRIAAVAAIVIAVFSAGLWMYQRAERDAASVVVAANEVLPGNLGATLTLSSGKKIRLADTGAGELAKEAGVVISKSADGKLVYELSGSYEGTGRMNTLSTAFGETYQVRLPDGSMVWLNSASSLSYSSDLGRAGRRLVSLVGEGYFEVAKDRLRPFVVKTASQSVEVLGTHFNVNSYSDEPAVATTLLDGSVRVLGAAGERRLVPGEQALNGAEGIKVVKVEAENVVDWKDGDFYLNHVDFRVAMRKLSRWYDVDVVYEGTVPSDMETGGWISRSTKLSVVLKMIESSGLAKFRIAGRTVYVRK